MNYKETNDRKTDLNSSLFNEDDIQLWKKIFFQLSKLEKNNFKQKIKKYKENKEPIRILNVAAGYGTEAKILVHLLRLLGMNSEDINDAIYLIDINFLMVQELKSLKFKNVIHENFITWETDLKFDLIIGNIPFQAGNASKGEPLWPKFILKTESLLKKGGIVSLISPSSWLAGGFNGSSRKSILDDVFRNNDLTYADVRSDYIRDTYFKGVASKFGWFIYKKQPYSGITKIKAVDGLHNINLNNFPFLPIHFSAISISILQKIFFNNEKKFNIEHVHKAISSDLSKDITYRSDVETDELKIKHWVIGGNVDQKACFAFLKEDRTPKISSQKKVMFAIGGADNFKPYIDMDGISMAQQGFFIPLDDNATLEGTISIFYSRLFKYLTSGLRCSKYFKVNMLKYLPKMDCSKVWNDQELYKYFNLSREEIDFIETTIK